MDMRLKVRVKFAARLNNGCEIRHSQQCIKMLQKYYKGNFHKFQLKF